MYSVPSDDGDCPLACYLLYLSEVKEWGPTIEHKVVFDDSAYAGNG